MPRYVYGPSQAGRVVAGGDVSITLTGITNEGGVELVAVTIPAYDPAVSPKLLKVFAVYAPKPPEAETAAEYLQAPGRFVGSIEVDPGIAADRQIPVPGVTPGSWFVQTVLEFES